MFQFLGMSWQDNYAHRLGQCTNLVTSAIWFAYICDGWGKLKIKHFKVNALLFYITFLYDP